MTTSEFRPSSPADAGAIASLCRRVLAVPEGSPAFSPRHMDWKYWQSWPDWQGSRSYVLVRGEQVIAHGAVLPLVFARGGRRVTLLNLYDWASDPTAVGSGAALVKRIAALADGMVVAGGSEMTRRMAGPLGFRRFGEVTRHARPVDRGERDGRGGGAAWSPLETIGDAALLCPESTAGEIRFQRSPAALAELLRCPVASMEYHAAAAGGFLLAFTPGQARIAGTWSGSEDSDDWTGLARLACRAAAARPDAAEVVALASTPLEQQALLAAGFRSCGTDPLSVMARPDLIPDGTSFRFQLLDCDGAFLHHGAPEPWLGSPGPAP